jgi:hypothetical protein
MLVMDIHLSMRFDCADGRMLLLMLLLALL